MQIIIYSFIIIILFLFLYVGYINAKNKSIVDKITGTFIIVISMFFLINLYLTIYSPINSNNDINQYVQKYNNLSWENVINLEKENDNIKIKEIKENYIIIEVITDKNKTIQLTLQNNKGNSIVVDKKII